MPDAQPERQHDAGTPSAAPSLLALHHLMADHFGDLAWWPAETPFEVAVGAILTQNTAWPNVEKAIDNLRAAEALAAPAIAALPLDDLEGLIRPSGFYRQKARRLKSFAEHLVRSWDARIERICEGPLDIARARLLEQNGIGPETADSILLYAAQRPSFVVDAYTRRVFARIGRLSGNETYEQIQAFFMQALPEDAALFNAYHAEIVQLAKTFCRKRAPRCPTCPLNSCCDHARNDS